MKRYAFPLTIILLLFAVIALAAPGDKRPAVTSAAIGLGTSSSPTLASVTATTSVTAPAFNSSAADGYHYVLPYNSIAFAGTPSVGMIQTTPTGPQWYTGSAWEAIGSGGASAIADLTDWPSGLTATELGYLDGATSNIQAQINAISVGSPVTTAPTYSDQTCTAGQYAFDASYAYFCRTENTWDRIALGGWINPTPDTTPDAFSFTDETDIAISTAKTSNSITVAGINSAAAISVTGDTGFGYSKNSAACTATSGTVVAGDTVAACVTSSGSNSTATTATITIGGVADTYSVTTAAGGASTYLINQNFETVSTGYDNGETWTPTIGSGGVITPNYTTDPLVGNQSMYMSAATVVVSNKSPVFSAQTELYGYFAFKIAATPTTSTTILEIKGDAGTGTTSIMVHTDGKIKMYHGTTAVYTTAAVTAGTQYHVWYRTKQGSGADGIYQLWLSTSSAKPATPAISGTNGTSTSNYTYIRPQINYNNNIIFDRILTGAESIGSDPS